MARCTAPRVLPDDRTSCHEGASMMRNWIAGAACAAGIVLAATACSSGSSSTAASPATSSATAQASSPAAAASGQASSASASCTGACAAAWPPVTVTGTPQAGTGVNQAKLGTVKRADGTEQLTYNHHPLYLFAGDASTGVAHGQGSKEFGASWYVLSASGAKIDND